MKSKIEKLDYVLIEGYDALKPERKGDVDYNCLAEKINEIIDHLNSQDQEEEKLILTEYQVGLLSKIRSGDYLYKEHILKEGLTTVLVELLRNDTTLLYNIIRDNIGDERIVDAINSQVNIQDTQDNDRELQMEMANSYPLKPDEYIEDTPEQTESDVQEWEKKWEEFFLYVTNDKNWVDGRPEWKGNVYITLYNAMKDFIRQLLEERGREVINETVDNFNDLDDRKFRIYLARRLLKLLKNE